MKCAIEPASGRRSKSRVAALDLADEPLDPRIVVPVAADVDRVVEEHVPAGRDELAPALEVGARALVGVVAVDEDERAGTRRRLGGARVADDELDAVRELVAVERRPQLRVELRPAQVGADRDVEVVRPELGARRGARSRASAWCRP